MSEPEPKSRKVTVSYSHAAPYVREKLLMAVRSASDARTLRERTKQVAMAYAYADTLRIMADADDQTSVSGIAGQKHVDDKTFAWALRFMGRFDQYRVVLGPTAPTVEPRPWPWEEKAP